MCRSKFYLFVLPFFYCMPSYFMNFSWCVCAESKQLPSRVKGRVSPSGFQLFDVTVFSVGVGILFVQIICWPLYGLLGDYRNVCNPVIGS